MMNWEQRYRLVQTARTSLAFAATLSLIAAIACSAAVRRIDRDLNWSGLGYTEEGARAVLGTLVGSMLTFIVFVLSATLIVVQLASGQLTPRVIALVLTKSSVKFALASLTFTYAFTLSTLGRIDDRVPNLFVAVAVTLNLVSLIVFLLFVQQFSIGLRPASLMQFVGARARPVAEFVYPTSYDPARAEQNTTELLPKVPTRVVLFEGRAGVLMAFSAARLVRIAQKANAVLELVPQVGDAISSGDALFRVFGEVRPMSDGELRGCVAIGAERTLEQDPRFAFRILVDIANKALSPAINDPTTSVLALDQIDELLRCIGRRRLDEGISCDDAGKLRLVYDTPDWPDFVTLAVTEIRHYGHGSIQVNRRLRAMLEHLIEVLPEARRPSLEQELNLLKAASLRAFPDEADRKRADMADHQGVGGSET